MSPDIDDLIPLIIVIVVVFASANLNQNKSIEISNYEVLNLSNLKEPVVLDRGKHQCFSLPELNPSKVNDQLSSVRAKIFGDDKHIPILIDNNTHFENQASTEDWPGNGTLENPYIIKNLLIDRGGNDGFCIEIYNTTVHFIIRNCSLHGATKNNGAGIYLKNVTNGQLIRNDCTNNFRGIALENSTNITISSNNCSINTEEGIYLNSSVENTLSDNICENGGSYGIYFHEGSDLNVVRNNSCSTNGGTAGIFLLKSKDNTLQNNNCTDSVNGIYISIDGFFNEIIGNNCTNNTETSIYLWARRNTVLENNCTGSYYGIHVYLVNYCTIANNTCNNNTKGIYIDSGEYNIVSNNICWDNICGIGDTGSHNELVHNICWNNTDGIVANGGNSKVFYNTCFNNTDCGIEMNSLAWSTLKNNLCYNNTFGLKFSSIDTYDNFAYYNTLHNNTYGIFLELADTNTIGNNTCYYNDYGIYLDSQSDNNNMNWNSFYLNTKNGIDDGSSNTFEFNHWGDYMGSDEGADGYGDDLYVIYTTLGDPNTSDPNPLMYNPAPPIWIEEPTDHLLEVGDAFRYDLNATAYAPLGSWWLVSTIFFTIDSNGVITNATFLSEDIYKMEVRVNNFYGFTLSGKFTVVVEDTTNPEWIQYPSHKTLEHGQSFSYDLDASDLSGIDSWTINDTNNFQISGIGIITNKIPLPLGDFWLEVRAYDPHENFISAVFKVTVQDTTPPKVDHPNDISYIEGTDTDVWIVWHPSDTLPASYVVSRNGSELEKGSWNSSTEIIQVSVQGLSEGIYNYTIVVTDTSGHTASDSVLVTVRKEIGTTTTTKDTTSWIFPVFLLFGLIMAVRLKRKSN